MTATAVILLVISAVIHAGWNLIGKRLHSSAASFMAASAIGVLVLLPFPIAFYHVVPAFPPRVWLLVAGTGLFQAIYYTSLAEAYRRGDMSIVYPVARSTPAVFVALVSLLLGRIDQISARALAGIVSIVAGGYLLPMQHFKDFSIRKYLSSALLFALFAAIGTAGYSLVDDTALRISWNVVDAPTWQVSGVYAFFEGSASAVWMAVYVLLNRRERHNLRRLFTPGTGTIRSAALMGFSIYITYTIVLASMAFVRDVSYVVAFRQLSIPIGVLLGSAILKEKLYIPKIIGALLMFAGLVLVATG